MRHILINILLLFSLISVGQNQQVLRNGFVAATNLGIYYLQDGFNEWVSLSDSTWEVYGDMFDIYYGDYTISTNKDKVFTFKKGLTTSTGNYSLEYGYIYGDKFSEFKISFWEDGEFEEYISCKLSYTNSAVVAHSILNEDYSSLNYFNRSHSGFCYYNIGQYLITDIETNNDNIILFVGEENSITKFTINSESFTNLTQCDNMTKTDVSGLSSATSSLHKVGYEETLSKFWIVSEEGLVYSYDNSTITYHQQLAYQDTCMDVLCSNSALYEVLRYSSSPNEITILKWGYTGSPNILFEDETISNINYANIAFNNSGNIGFSRDENIFDIIDSSTGNSILSTNLPTGVIVFDLDYINYLQ